MLPEIRVTIPKYQFNIVKSMIFPKYNLGNTCENDADRYRKQCAKNHSFLEVSVIPKNNTFLETATPSNFNTPNQRKEKKKKTTSDRSSVPSRRAHHCMASVPRPLLRALFISSSLMRCSMRYWAVVMECGLPVMVTMRLRVPGAKMPFFEIWMLAPLICWISTRDLPPGPAKPTTNQN